MGAKRSVQAPVITELPEIGVTVISKWLYNCYVIHDGGNGQPFVVDLGMPSQIPLVAGVLSAASEARLRSLDVEHLLPGHGLVVTGPRVMTEARTHTDQPSIGAKTSALWRVLRNHAGRQ